MPSNSELGPLAALIAEYREDLARGEPKSLSDYLAKFSGDDSLSSSQSPGDDADIEGFADHQVGPYQVIAEIGRGGQGVVYLAEDLRLGRRVALKTLEAFRTLSRTAMMRFRREAQIAASLEHPHVCRIYDVGIDNAVPYIAMQYVPGETLAERIASDKERATSSSTSMLELPATFRNPQPTNASEATPILRIVWLMEILARATHAIHEAGIIHRDIKPSNIMISESGHPMMMDFGLSRSLEGDESLLTAPGDAVGTPAYMAPEQIQATGHSLDPRTDIWALGCVFYECLTLKRPFQQPTRERLFNAITHERPADPRRANPRISPELSAILQTSMAKEMERRYESALEFAEDLARLRRGEAVLAKPEGILGRVWRWCKRRPAAALMILTLAATTTAAATLGGYILSQRTNIELAERLEKSEKVDQLLAIGLLSEIESDFEESAAVYAKALSIDPSSVEAAHALAESMRRSGRVQEAYDLFQTQEFKHRSELDRTRVILLSLLGRRDEASKIEGKLKPAETALEAHVISSLAMLRTGKAIAKTAFDAAQRAVILSPRPRFSYLSRLILNASLVRNSELVESAALALEAHWAEWPMTAAVIGSAYINMGQHDRGLTALRRSVEREPGNRSFKFSLAAGLAAAGQPQEAIPLYREIIDGKSPSPKALQNLGVLLDQSGQFDEATKLFEEAYRIAPNQAPINSALGSHYARRGNYEKALTLFTRAVELDPEYAGNHLNLSGALRGLGKNDEAIAALERAIALDPDNFMSRHNLGRLFQEVGRDKESRVQLEAARVLAPREGAIHRTLINTLIKLKDHEGLIYEYGRWTTVLPTDSRAWRDLAIALLHKGNGPPSPTNLGKALHAANRAVELADPPDALSLYTLARAMIASGQNAEASATLKKAMECNQEQTNPDPKLKSAIERLQEKLSS